MGAAPFIRAAASPTPSKAATQGIAIAHIAPVDNPPLLLFYKGISVEFDPLWGTAEFGIDIKVGILLERSLVISSECIERIKIEIKRNEHFDIYDLLNIIKLFNNEK